MENTPIRFIQSHDINGAVFYEKVNFNVGLTDHEIVCLQTIIREWREERGFADEDLFPPKRQRVTRASTARRIEREINRAMDRSQTHFE